MYMPKRGCTRSLITSLIIIHVHHRNYCTMPMQPTSTQSVSISPHRLHTSYMLDGSDVHDQCGQPAKSQCMKFWLCTKHILYYKKTFFASCAKVFRQFVVISRKHPTLFVENSCTLGSVGRFSSKWFPIVRYPSSLYKLFLYENMTQPLLVHAHLL